jgi:long-subunit acyl-CoA synthetase (AMP-forming)
MSTAAPELPRSFAASTLCEAFQITAAERPDAVALRTPGGAVEISWAEYADRVRRLAALGVGHGDTVALMMTNRPEFNLVDTAAMHLGATPYSIYNTSAPDQISYLFSNADNRVIVCDKPTREHRTPVQQRLFGLGEKVIGPLGHQESVGDDDSARHSRDMISGCTLALEFP